MDDLAEKLNILLGAETTATLTTCKAFVDSIDYASADKAGQSLHPLPIDPFVAFRPARTKNCKNRLLASPKPATIPQYWKFSKSNC